MLEIIKKNQNNLILLGLFFLGLIIGLPLCLNNIASDYFDFALLLQKIEYLNDNNYINFFMNSTFSYENSLLFSLLLMLNKNGSITYYHIISIIISVSLYVLFFIAFYKISKKDFIHSLIFIIPFTILVINTCFQNTTSSYIETKMALIGILLLFILKDIENKNLKLLFNMAILLFFYNILFLILIFIDLIYELCKNKNIQIRKIILLLESIILAILLLDLNLGFNISWLFKVFLNVVDFAPSKVFYPYSVLVSFFILLLFIFNIIVLLIKEDNKDKLIKSILLGGIFTAFVSITNINQMNIEYSLRYYFSLFYIGIIFYDYQYIQKNKIKMNLFNSNSFSFSIIKTLSLIYILLQIIGLSSIDYKSVSMDELNYRIKYDYDYNYVTGKIDENNDYKVLALAIRNSGMTIDFDIPENEDYTIFKNSDIFVYGYGEVEDDNGSRWIEKKSAVNMYGREGDDLLFSIYNPSDKVGVDFEIYVDNVLVYSGTTIEGQQNLYIDCNIKTGNHIIKTILTNFNAGTRYGLYVTNVVMGRFD
ncbi:MAG: hypothetical protein ACI35S_07625 [Anaeroplasma sp.]